MSDAEIARREASEWLILLREEPDDAELCKRFKAWYGDSPANAAAWESVNETFDILGQALTADQQKSSAPIRKTARPVIRYVAALAIACSFALWILPTVRLYLEADYMTGAGQFETVQLDDGSLINLGPDSAVTVDYTADQRHIHLLSGQAYFDVQSNPQRPFQVRTGDITTTVLGTAFEVRLLGTETAVAVRHGHVRVKDMDSAPYDLRAGDWLRVKDDHSAVLGTAAPELVGIWQQGKLLVRGRTIGEVIDEIRPWFAGKIIVTATGLEQFRMTGVYDVRDPAAALSALVTSHGGVVRQVTPWIMIISKK